jgi:hypothetical protein
MAQSKRPGQNEYIGRHDISRSWGSLRATLTASKGTTTRQQGTTTRQQGTTTRQQGTTTRQQGTSAIADTREVGGYRARRLDERQDGYCLVILQGFAAKAAGRPARAHR